MSMKLFEGSKLAVIVLFVFFNPLYAAASVDAPRYLVFVSDPQYPWSDLTDAGLPDDVAGGHVWLLGFQM